MPRDIPNASPMPIRAIPTVAAVVQLLPVAIEIIALMTTQAPRNMVGFNI